MKNPYETLEIKENATIDEIFNAYNADKTNLDKETAFRQLINPQIKSKIDSDLKAKREANSVNNSNNKKKKENGSNKLIVFAVTASLILSGINLYRSFKNDKTDTNNKVLASSSTEETTEDETKLVVEDFDSNLQAIINNDSNNGLIVNPDFTKSALFLANLSQFNKDDIEQLYSDLNTDKEITQARQYIAAVIFNNCSGDKYISLASLSYNDTDKYILKSLDDELVSINNKISNSSITKDEIETSLNKMFAFYNGSGAVAGSDGNLYMNTNLTPGGEMISAGIWAQLGNSYYMVSQFLTNEDEKNITTIDKYTIPKLRYELDMNAYVNEQCNSNTLTK